MTQTQSPSQTTDDAESAAASDAKPTGWRRVWYELRPIVVMLVVLFSFRSAVAHYRAAAGYELESIFGRSHPVMSLRNVLNEKRNYGPITVPAGKYFMMGDNRDNSEDSRFADVGFVPRDSIVGRSSRVVLSLDYDDY